VSTFTKVEHNVQTSSEQRNGRTLGQRYVPQ